ncbi:MAG: tRNA uridine-5-carboxymethylaminomethyl(34) synthesis GTPase MnmE [Candidatus Caenarcaniphilales bacterium]|jgi:tRNA modification GTPase|nr:tRNA uridine-5-carboxymethylaminomethyl(34) synthesis GTPase MnmE [Candidatus Caenarcaniphilales bacterium]
MYPSDTIAAIVTAPAKAAVSIIRISGKNSWEIIQRLSSKIFIDHQIQLSWIYENENKLDQALILPFKAPKSFTGEDVIEIHSHGGIWLTEKILELVLNSGARLAQRGEFTQRAVINGKMDLSQAEAIADIIDAKSASSSQNAIKIYQGELGSQIKSMRLSLLNLLGEVTASIDFPDEVGEFDRQKFSQIILQELKQIDILLAGEKEGHILRNGYKVAIVGNPNAGKSTLLNSLLKKERAIVTDIAGTTRDLIEESYSIKGLPIVLLDTAGIRETEDKIEKIGIEKSYQAIQEADLILHLIDMTNYTEEDYDQENLRVGTKLDLVSDYDEELFDICISSKNDQNIEELKNMIYDKIIQLNTDLVKINLRQADLLRHAKQALDKSLEASKNLSEDFWTIDLRQAIQSLGEITGETLTEELLDNIFARFCIGK